MNGTTSKLTTAVETYFADLRRVHASGPRPESVRAMARLRFCSTQSAERSSRRCSTSASLPTRAQVILTSDCCRRNMCRRASRAQGGAGTRGGRGETPPLTMPGSLRPAIR